MNAFLMNGIDINCDQFITLYHFWLEEFGIFRCILQFFLIRVSGCLIDDDSLSEGYHVLYFSDMVICFENTE